MVVSIIVVLIAHWCIVSHVGMVTVEPSHSRGAPEVPEPLTFIWQLNISPDKNIWKKFVRATRPAPVCAITGGHS